MYSYEDIYWVGDLIEKIIYVHGWNNKEEIERMYNILDEMYLALNESYEKQEKNIIPLYLDVKVNNAEVDVLYEKLQRIESLVGRIFS